MLGQNIRSQRYNSLGSTESHCNTFYSQKAKRTNKLIIYTVFNIYNVVTIGKKHDKFDHILDARTIRDSSTE